MKRAGSVSDQKRRAALRAGARRTALDALSSWHTISGKNRLALKRPRVYFPYLHDVPKVELGMLRNFIDLLSKDHVFLPYSEAVDRVLDGPIDKPYVAFSFDDGFSSNVLASRVLEDYGARACFFVPPGFLDTKLSTKDSMKKFGFAKGTREEPMTWTDLEKMKARGHEIGNHTMNHKTLSEISEWEAVDEISSGAERIRQIIGECRHFAWPRGQFKHFTDTAARMVFDSGHHSCASAERGSHILPLLGDQRLLCLRRDHIMTSWPLRHSKYFVGKGSEVASESFNFWPEGWSVAPS